MKKWNRILAAVLTLSLTAGLRIIVSDQIGFRLKLLHHDCVVSKVYH